MKPFYKHILFFVSLIPLLIAISCGSDYPYYTKDRTSLEQPEIVYRTPSISYNEDQIAQNVENRIRGKMMNGWRQPGATNLGGNTGYGLGNGTGYGLGGGTGYGLGGGTGYGSGGGIAGANANSNFQAYGNASLPSRPYFCDPTFFPNMDQTVNACRLFENQFAGNVGFRADTQAFDNTQLTYPLTPNVIPGVTDTPGPWPPTGGPFLDFNNIFPNGLMGVPGILDGPYDFGDGGDCGGDGCPRRGPSGFFKGNPDFFEDFEEDDGRDRNWNDDDGRSGARDSEFRGPWQFFGPRLFGGEWPAPLFGFDDDVDALRAHKARGMGDISKGRRDNHGNSRNHRSRNDNRNAHKRHGGR